MENVNPGYESLYMGNNDEKYNITLDACTPNPILSSTAHQKVPSAPTFSRKSLEFGKTAGPNNVKQETQQSPEGSLKHDSIRDISNCSSLSLLDINALHDAQSTTSLFHFSSKEVTPKSSNELTVENSAANLHTEDGDEEDEENTPIKFSNDELLQLDASLSCDDGSLSCIEEENLTSDWASTIEPATTGDHEVTIFSTASAPQTERRMMGSQQQRTNLDFTGSPIKNTVTGNVGSVKDVTDISVKKGSGMSGIGSKYFESDELRLNTDDDAPKHRMKSKIPRYTFRKKSTQSITDQSDLPNSPVKNEDKHKTANMESKYFKSTEMSSFLNDKSSTLTNITASNGSQTRLRSYSAHLNYSDSVIERCSALSENRETTKDESTLKNSEFENEDGIELADIDNSKYLKATTKISSLDDSVSFPADVTDGSHSKSYTSEASISYANSLLSLHSRRKREDESKLTNSGMDDGDKLVAIESKYFKSTEIPSFVNDKSSIAADGSHSKSCTSEASISYANSLLSLHSRRKREDESKLTNSGMDDGDKLVAIESKYFKSTEIPSFVNDKSSIAADDAWNWLKSSTESGRQFESSFNFTNSLIQQYSGETRQDNEDTIVKSRLNEEDKHKPAAIESKYFKSTEMSSFGNDKSSTLTNITAADDSVSGSERFRRRSSTFNKSSLSRYSSSENFDKTAAARENHYKFTDSSLKAEDDDKVAAVESKYFKPTEISSFANDMSSNNSSRVADARASQRWGSFHQSDFPSNYSSPTETANDVTNNSDKCFQTPSSGSVSRTNSSVITTTSGGIEPKYFQKAEMSFGSRSPSFSPGTIGCGDTNVSSPGTAASRSSSDRSSQNFAAASQFSFGQGDGSFLRDSARSIISEKNHRTSTHEKSAEDPFSDWQKCTDFPPMNRESNQTELDASSSFQPNDRGAELLDEEQKKCAEEHELSLASNFNEKSRQDASSVPTSFSMGRSPTDPITLSDCGKVSISTYMRYKSDKLGGLGSTVDEKDRPSFGMNLVRSPEDQETDEKVEEKYSTPESLEHTTNESLMKSLSKLITNTTVSINSDDLAQNIFNHYKDRTVRRRIDVANDQLSRPQEEEEVGSTPKQPASALRKGNRKGKNVSFSPHVATPIFTKSLYSPTLSRTGGTSDEMEETLTDTALSGLLTPSAQSVFQDAAIDSTINLFQESQSRFDESSPVSPLATDKTNLERTIVDDVNRSTDDEPTPPQTCKRKIEPSRPPPSHSTDPQWLIKNAQLTRGTLGRETLVNLHNRLRYEHFNSPVADKESDYQKQEEEEEAEFDTNIERQAEVVGPETTSPQSMTSSIEPLTHSSPEEKVIDGSRLSFDENEESGGRPSEIFQGLVPQISDSTQTTIDYDVTLRTHTSGSEPSLRRHHHPVQSNVRLEDDKEEERPTTKVETKKMNLCERCSSSSSVPSSSSSTCCSLLHRCHHQQPLILLVNDPATLASIIHGGNPPSRGSALPSSYLPTSRYCSGVRSPSSQSITSYDVTSPCPADSRMSVGSDQSALGTKMRNSFNQKTLEHSLHFPPDVKIEEDICVGLTGTVKIPITNKFFNKVKVSLTITSFTIDNTHHAVDEHAVVKQRHLVIAPQHTEHADVCVRGCEEGEYRFRVEIHVELHELLGVPPYHSGYVEVLARVRSPKVEFDIDSSSTSSNISSSLQSEIFTNKSSIRWGYVAVGEREERNMQMILKRKCGKDPGRVSLAIIGRDAQFFRLVDEVEGEVDRLRPELYPNVKKNVMFSFKPGYSAGLFHAFLRVKLPISETSSEAIKYTIPLCGYSGTSKVLLSAGITPTNHKSLQLYNNYIPQVNRIRFNEHEKNKSFDVTNTGDRAAFINIQVYKDFGCFELYDAVHCSPSRFVIGARQTVSVVVDISSTTPFHLPCIAIWHGNELSRKLMRLAKSRQVKFDRMLPNSLSSDPSSPIRSIDFDLPFVGEGCLSSEIGDCRLDDGNKHSYDVRNFYEEIRQTLLLVEVCTTPATTYMTQATTTTIPSTNNERAEMNKLPVFQQTDELQLSPHYITMYHAPSRTHGSYEETKLRIKNPSPNPVEFDITFPKTYIAVYPAHDRVKPWSEKTVLLTPNPSLTSQELPYRGKIFVASKSTCKMIPVQINERCATVLSATSSNVSAITKDFQLPEKESFKPELQLASDVVDYGGVEVGKHKKEMIEFVNKSSYQVRWTISTLAPACLRRSSGEIERADVFKYSQTPSNNVIKPGATATIPCIFTPSHVGHYSQQLRIQYYNVPGLNEEMHETPVVLEGEGVAKSRRSISSTSSSRRSSSALANKSGCIYTCDEEQHFGCTKVGVVKSKKILINNGDTRPHTVQITNVQPPFYVTRTSCTIKPRYSTSLVVHFKPNEIGGFENVMVVKSDDGRSLKQKLIGNAN